MPRIDATREELREVVNAGFYAQSQEGAEISKRLYEEIGTPYNPQEEEEAQKQALNLLMVDPCVDSLMGTISDEEFRAKVNQILREYAQAQMPKDIEETTDEEEKEELRQMVGGMMDAVMNSMWDYCSVQFPTGDAREKSVQYYNYVFQVAKERGIPPAQVITDAELRREVFRNTMTRDEYQARIKKVFVLLDPDKLLDVILKPMFRALAGEIEKDGEDPDEVYNEFKEEAMQDTVFQQQMKTLQDVAPRILEEETNKIYG